MGSDPNREITRSKQQVGNVAAVAQATPQAVLDLGDVFMVNVATQLSTVAGTSVNVLTATFQYSIDNTNWTTLASSTVSNVNAPQQTTTGIICRYIQFNPATLSFTAGTILNWLIAVSRSFL